MSEYEYDKNKPGGAVDTADRDAPGVMTADPAPVQPNGASASDGNWESDDWSMRSSSVDEDDPLIKLARLMEQNERNFEVAAQRSNEQVAEPVYSAPPPEPVPAAQSPEQDEWSEEYSPAPQQYREPQVQEPPAPVSAPEAATSALSRSLREPVQPAPIQPAVEPTYVAAPQVAEPLMASSDLGQHAAPPPPVSVDVPAQAAFEAPQRPSPITTFADDEQHDPFAPGGSSRPLPDRDFDVSRMPRAIRPEVAADHSDLGGLHGQAGSDLAAAELPVAETNFQTSAVRVPEPVRSEPIVESEQVAQAPSPLTAELTRYADAVGDTQPRPTQPPMPDTVAANQLPPQMRPVQPEAQTASVQPASELSAAPMPKPDFSYLREVEDLRVPAANTAVEAPADEVSAPEVAGEVYQVQDADILYEEYDDDNSPGLFASRGMMVAAGVVAFVVLGGAALLAYQAIFSGDDSGPPPLVLADKTPVRILPDGQAADADGTSDIGSLTEPGTAADGQLVPRAEEPVTNINPNIDQGRSVRVVDNQGVSPTTDPLGPRPVRTFVVRPDGSIVSNSSTGAATNTNNGIQPRVVTTQPISGNGSPAPAVNTNNSASGVAVPRPRPNAGGTQVSSAQPAAGTSTVGGRAALPVAPRVSVGTNAPAFNPNAPAVQPSNRVPAGNVIPETTPRVAQPATPAATTAPASSGDFVVQVSSQRSEEAARSAYAGLQRRFPSVLGNQAPDIARADLGSRGVFYRVRVGPMETRQAASNLCQSLKNAGGDCIVARR